MKCLIVTKLLLIRHVEPVVGYKRAHNTTNARIYLTNDGIHLHKFDAFQLVAAEFNHISLFLVSFPFVFVLVAALLITRLLSKRIRSPSSLPACPLACLQLQDNKQTSH